MPINPLPAPPSRGDPANFAQRGDAFMAALPPFAVELEAARVEVVAKEASAVDSATTATTKAGEASASAGSALASKNAAVLSASAALDSQNAAATSAGTASTKADTATTKAAEAAASAASVVRDGSGGVAGLTGFALNIWNAAKTFKSLLSFAGTANRAHVLPDKDGTVALVSDITGGTQAVSATTLTATGALTTAGIKEDAAGNVGLSVTPKAWGNQGHAIQIGQLGSVNEQYFSANNDQVAISSNLYRGQDTSYRYINGTNKASAFVQFEGEFRWLSVAAGVADGAVAPGQPMTLDSSGILMLGTTTSGPANSNSYAFTPGQQYTNHVVGAGSGFGYSVFGYNGGTIGSITQSGTTAVLYNTTSDYRLKANARPLTGSGAFIDALKPTAWEWTRDGRKDAGFIAHEFQEVCPNAVNGVKDETEVQTYEVSPAVAAVSDKRLMAMPANLTADEIAAFAALDSNYEFIEITPSILAVTATRTVPKYQSMQASSAEVIANLVAELQDLRRRLSAAGIA